MQRSLSRILKDAQALGLGVCELCAKSGVARSTIQRGKADAKIGGDVFGRLEAVIRETAAVRAEVAKRVLAE